MITVVEGVQNDSIIVNPQIGTSQSSSVVQDSIEKLQIMSLLSKQLVKQIDQSFNTLDSNFITSIFSFGWESCRLPKNNFALYQN